MSRRCDTCGFISLLVSLTCLFTAACSLGTEVGNGLKPGNPGSNGSGTGPTVTSDSSDQPPKITSVNSVSQADSGLFAPFKSGDTFEQVTAADQSSRMASSLSTSAGGLATGILVAGGAASASSSIGSAVLIESEVAKIKSNFSAVPVAISDSQLTEANFPLLMVDLAFTGCGSPLADLSAAGAATFKLSISGEQRGIFEIKPAADLKNWEIRGSGGVLIRTVTPITVSNSLSTIHTVSASDAAGAVLSPISVCSDIKSTADVTLAGRSGKFTKKSVKLASSKGYSQLVWYQESAAISSGNGKIVLVSLTANADSLAPFAVFDTP